MTIFNIHKYRFSKRFGERIVDLLRGDLSHDRRGFPLSPEMQVACALRNWARHEVSVYQACNANNADIYLRCRPFTTL